MEAVAWTAIGLLGTTQALLVAALFHLSSRIEAQGRDLHAAIDAQGQRIDAQGQRIDAQGQGLREAIDGQGHSLRAAIDSLNARMDAHIGQHTA